MRGARNIFACLILSAALGGCVFDPGYGHRSDGGYYGGGYSNGHNGGYGGYGNGYHRPYYSH